MIYVVYELITYVYCNIFYYTPVFIFHIEIYWFLFKRSNLLPLSVCVSVKCLGKGGNLIHRKSKNAVYLYG
jgi:hypothetical protein